MAVSRAERQSRLDAGLFYAEPALPQLERFEELWPLGPFRPMGKKAALRHFMASVKTDADWQAIQQARLNYAADLKRNPRPLLHGSTWFNNWRDFAELDIAKEAEMDHGEYAAKVKGTKA